MQAQLRPFRRARFAREFRERVGAGYWPTSLQEDFNLTTDAADTSAEIGEFCIEK
jgi:hypothetical protein